MPDANEVLGCPHKQIFYRFISQKFLKTFLVVSLNFTFISLYFYFILTIHLQTILTTFFSLILSRTSFLCPLILDARGRLLFSLIFIHSLAFTYTFLKKTPSLDAPPGWIPGAIAPPRHPPLHATGEK